MRRGSRERHLVAAVVVGFAVAIAFFIASRAITEVVSRRIHREAESMSDNALTATEVLVGARMNLRKLVADMSAVRASDGSSAGARRLAHEIDVSRRDTAAYWAKYVSIPFYPGERELADEVQPDVAAAELAVVEMSERLHQGDRAGALQILDRRALPALERADQGLALLLQINQREARNAGLRILEGRRPWGFWPEVLGAFFAMVAAYLGIRLLVQYLAWASERSAELEQFAGRVAHDIRSPLGSASLVLEVAQRGKDVDPRTRELLARLGRTMQRIGQLVDGLLVFATSGGYIVPRMWGEPKTDVGGVLAGVVEDTRAEAGLKNIDIDYLEPAEPTIAACSPGVFISVMTNLISNAMKFMGDAPVRRITIRVRRAADDVEIQVSDTGPGIPAEKRRKVFEPYVRGGSNVPGFGMGLATVRRLVETHGGAVWLDESPEGGCRFWFRLPVWKEAAGTRAWNPFRTAVHHTT